MTHITRTSPGFQIDWISPGFSVRVDFFEDAKEVEERFAVSLEALDSLAEGDTICEPQA